MISINKIIIVYFCYLNKNSDFKNIIKDQLNELKDTGLTNIPDVHIYSVLSGKEEDFEIMKKEMIKIFPKINIETTTLNQWEYCGIDLVWRLAKEHKNLDTYILYFHSKGISYNIKQRCPVEIKLFQDVIVPWKKVLNIFKNMPEINKIGFTASENGWMWFNFWWARSKYLANCEKPILTNNKYYYEDWLHRNEKDIVVPRFKDCFSIGNNIDQIKCFSPEESIAMITK